MLTQSLIAGMNALEFILVVMLLLVFLRFFLPQTERQGRSIAALVVLAAGAATAVEATQFMTLDENGITSQLIAPDKRAISQIGYGAFKTGTLIALPIVRTMQVFGADPEMIRVTLKAAWWMCANLLFLAIALSSVRLASGRQFVQPLLVTGVYAALALLPTSQLAAKTINYDLLSCTLPVLSVLFLLKGVTERSWPAALRALPIAALAAQEKLTASPILITTIVALALAAGLGAKGRREAAQHASAAAALLVLGSTAIFILSALAYGILAWPVSTWSIWGSILDPFSSWAWSPLSVVFPISSILEHRLGISMLAIAAVICGSALLAAASIEFRALADWVSRWPDARWYGIRLVLACSVFAIGAIGAPLLNGYWAPFHPSPIAGETFSQVLNGVSLHVGATTPATHILGMLAYAMVILVVAIPSATWLAGAFGLCVGRSSVRRQASSAALQISTVLIGASLLLPVASALMGAPFAHRYFNTSILLLVIGLLLPAICAIDRLWRRSGARKTALLVLSFSALLLAEMLPFKPLYAAFRPFWLNYPDSQRAEPGRLNASWMDWGESVMLAAKDIERDCLGGKFAIPQDQCRDITLVPQIPGIWLSRPDRITIGKWPRRGEPVAASAKVYYLFSRLRLLQTTHLMPNLQPDYAVTFRGYALAWVYRGDRLAEAGYSLYPP